MVHKDADLMRARALAGSWIIQKKKKLFSFFMIIFARKIHVRQQKTVYWNVNKEERREKYEATPMTFHISLTFLCRIIVRPLLFFSFPPEKRIYIPHKVHYCYSKYSLRRLHDYHINFFNLISFLPTLLLCYSTLIASCAKKGFWFRFECINRITKKKGS